MQAWRYSGVYAFQASQLMKLQKLLVLQIGFLIAIVCSNNSTAQVCATPGLSGPNAALSGTLNSYYPGTGASVSIGATSVPVGAIDTTSGGASTAIATGDLLIVIQMQGARVVQRDLSRPAIMLAVIRRQIIVRVIGNIARR